MIYELKCGCDAVSLVESDIPSFEWPCPSCEAVNVSSVPTDGNGGLIQNVGQGGFVAVNSEGIENVVKSHPVGFAQKALDMVNEALEGG